MWTEGLNASYDVLSYENPLVWTGHEFATLLKTNQLLPAGMLGEKNDDSN